MKKLLSILMVIVMTSFLFTGCLPTTNNAPIFTSTYGTTATVGTTYTYTPTATDADGDTVTFSVAGPTGMAISAGVITWLPTAVGSEAVVVTATDGTDSTTQSFTITVSAAADTSAAAVAAVLVAATAAAADATEAPAFFAALANAAFTGYLAANNAAYFLAVNTFTAVTTVAGVNAAILAVNTAPAVVVAAAAVAAVNAATTSVTLNAALANAAFTGYLVASYNNYFTSTLFTGSLANVAAVNEVIAVVPVNAATTSVTLNAALASAAFAGYVAANYDAYFASVALFTTAATPTVLTVNAVIAGVNAVVAVNAATTSLALNAALVNVNFANYLAINSAAYFTSIALFTTAPTVAAVDAAIVVVNAAVTAVPIAAAAVPLTFGPSITTAAGAALVPTVVGYTVTVLSSSVPAFYGLDGRPYAAGVSFVVFTITHTVTGLTANTGVVTVTVVP